MTNGLHIAGQEWPTQESYTVWHKWSGDMLAKVGEASPADAQRAIDAATVALDTPLTVHQRYRILESAATLLGERREMFALTIAQEAGKPLKDARVEVDRAQQTLRYSALAARTLHGEEVPIHGNPGSEKRLAFTLRKPYGVVLAITPFNFPLNLALHKVGPALAAGNAVILKPAPTTPLTALHLAHLLEDAGLPAGWINVVTGSNPEIGAWLVKNPGVHLVSFTGSAAVGEMIQASAGIKPVLLELGSNSANIVHADADLDHASDVLAQRSYAYSGQVCIAVQRIYVQASVYDQFLSLFQRRTESLVIGNPEDERVALGPMIDERAAMRVTEWIDEALSEGAVPLIRGARDGATVSPWLLGNVSPKAKVMREEVFGPVAVLTPYEDIEQAVKWANDSRYGLQAGLFTHNLDIAFYVAQHLEVGGLIVNDSSSYRADNMPYGGIKDSGIGREGPEYAVMEMTYPTTVVFNL